MQFFPIRYRKIPSLAAAVVVVANEIDDDDRQRVCGERKRIITSQTARVYIRPRRNRKRREKKQSNRRAGKGRSPPRPAILCSWGISAKVRPAGNFMRSRYRTFWRLLSRLVVLVVCAVSQLIEQNDINCDPYFGFLLLFTSSCWKNQKDTVAP